MTFLISLCLSFPFCKMALLNENLLGHEEVYGEQLVRDSHLQEGRTLFVLWYFGVAADMPGDRKDLWNLQRLSMRRTDGICVFMNLSLP